jgi:pyruvate ferredoxin oxidoreductase gamma subunit
MYRIRFHGRGGQGLKTASRILGTAFFLEGFEVQDAPRYGAERRGAPVSAFVRASREQVNERGIIHNPDLVIIADETLVMVPAAEVMHGVSGRTAILILSGEQPEVWRERLAVSGPLLTMPEAAEAGEILDPRYTGITCAGAAARLLGVISRSSLEEAIREELSHLGEAIIARNLAMGLQSFELMAPHGGCIIPGAGISAEAYLKPDWVDLPFEAARVSVPAVFAPATSENVKTGLWRTVRPVIEQSLCRRCGLCSSYCPEGGITVDGEGFPHIDYDHCKGCLICVAQCPSRAIRSMLEHDGKAEGGVQ